MKILQISIMHLVIVFVATSVLLFEFSIPASAATLAGFVTSIPAPMTFAIGTTTVTMSNTTTCIVARDSDFRLRETMLSRRPRFLPRGRHSAIKCMNLAPAMGAQIAVRGRFVNGGTFAADTVVMHLPSGPEDLRGGALLVETPIIRQVDNGFTGEAWIDGYPMQITPSTTILTAPAGTDFSYSIYGNTLQIGARIPSKASEPPFSADMLHPGMWMLYQATSEPDGRVTTGQMQLWSDEASPKEEEFVQEFEPVIAPPDYGRHVDGKIEFNSAPPILIIASAKIQEWVSSLGGSLVPTCLGNGTCSGVVGRQMRFLVVRQFPVQLGDYVVADGKLLLWNRDTRSTYTKPRPGSMVTQVVSLPDGTILVPDSVLVNLRNEAQLAALLSYAITSVVQHLAYHMNPRYMYPHSFGIGMAFAGEYYDPIPYDLSEYGQLLRLGIRQMYLAGFDIREAPFAGTVAGGSPAKNPLGDLKSLENETWQVPIYAFHYISQYYSDVDYSKLKRGEAEYAQFLDELRKADPEAFAEKK